MNLSSALRRVLALTVLLTGAAHVVASAQQTSTPGPTGTQTGRITGRSLREGRVRPQGFSVVLVVADLQGRGGPGEEDVPPAARKALADMKDFLPYKSYRLLDAAWILCCGTGRTVTRLRGPDDREYELEIESSAVSSLTDQARTAVQFVLRDATSADDPATPRAASGARTPQTSAAELERQYALTQERLEAARAKKTPAHPDVARLEQELQELRAHLAAITASRSLSQRVATTKAARSVMNTSFTMELGETVVVGTSRLSGNGKALIALLTAVPPKSSRR